MMKRCRYLTTLIATFMFVPLSGCAVVSVAGSVTSAAVSVASTGVSVASTGVSLGASGAKTLVTGSVDAAKPPVD